MIKSINHICFLFNLEFILVDDKNIYSCSYFDAINEDTHNRSGVYLCDLAFALSQKNDPFYLFLCGEIIDNKTELYRIANDYSLKTAKDVRKSYKLTSSIPRF